MRTVPYDPNNRTEIWIDEGRTATIEIDPKQCIHWNLFGLKDGPVGGPDKDQQLFHTLPLWGQRKGETNLNIVAVDCDDHYTEFTYPLLIHVNPAPDPGKEDPQATTRLKYTYEIQEKQQAQKVAQVSWKAKREKAEHDKLVARLAVEPFYQGPKGRNYKYLVTGDKSITPVINGGTSDNYSMTAFRFPGNMEAPAILIADGAPTEKMCEFKELPGRELLHAPEHTTPVRPQDDWIVVQQTSAHWRFRLGNGPSGKVADVFVCGYDPIGDNPGTGTPSPDVVRLVRSEK